MQQAQAMQQAVLLAVQHKGARAAGAGGGGEGEGYRDDSGGIRYCRSHRGGDIRALGVGAGRCWNNCRL